MKTYTVLFLISAGVSFTLTPVLLWLSRHYRWLDIPDGQRKIHTKPIPRIGGLAIFCACTLTLPLSLLWRNLIFDTLRWQWSDVVLLLVPASCIFLLGLYDDLRGLSARKKLALQLLAAVLLYYCGFRIEKIANPFLGSPLALDWLSLPVTVVWIVGVTNAFNLIDGMDGLAAGIAFFVSMSMFFVSLVQFSPLVSVLSIIMAGATLGFLRYNFNPARIFMGDGGSYFLGFVVSALAIKGSQKSSMVVSLAVPILLLGLPILDTMLAIFRRFLEGKPIFNPDQQHIHHRLMRLAHSQRFAVIILYGATAFLGLMSWLLVVTQNQMIALISLTVGLAAFWGIKSLGYEELQELGAYLTGLFSHRSGLAYQIYLRKMSDRLATCEALAEVMAMAREVLDRLSFERVEIRLWLAPPPLMKGNTPALRQYRWLWAPENSTIAPKPALLWELNAPLAGEQGTIGHLKLVRSVEKESLPPQWATIIQTLAKKLSAAAITIQEEEWARLFEIIPVPRQELPRAEARVGRR